VSPVHRVRRQSIWIGIIIHPSSSQPHNRQVDDCVAGEEEVLIEGVEVEVEAEEVEAEEVAEYVSVGKNN
jgi:hypothetical protein